MEAASLIDDLDDALDNDEFELWFQPVMDLDTLQICGAEGLARWRHKDYGILPPHRFLDDLDDGQELRFSQAMARQAIAFAARCRSLGDHSRISFNLSAKSFRDGTITESIISTIDFYNADPRDLMIEITEQDLVSDADQLTVCLTRLANLGVSLAIDDFGTGYSAFDRLGIFPVAELKIDRSFIANVAERPQDMIIVRSVVELGRLLHFCVVAEGIETREQLSFLREVGCDQGQGFLFHRPMPADEAFETLVSDAHFDSNAPSDASDSKRDPVELTVRTELDRLDTVLVDQLPSLALQVLDIAPLPVFLKGLDGRLVWCNESYRTRVGAVAGDLKGKSDFGFHLNNEAHGYREDDLQVLATGEPLIDRREWQTRPDGSRVRLRTSKFPLRNVDDVVVGLAGFYVEIGEAGEAWLDHDMQRLGLALGAELGSGAD